MVDQQKHTGFYRTYIHTRQPIQRVYGTARRTPPEGTPVDNGGILPYFPRPDRYGP